MIYTITEPGLHTLEWRYEKDSEVSNGNDLGRVDLVDWSVGPQVPTEPLSEALDTNLIITTDGDLGWFAQTAMSYFDGDAVQSGDIVDEQSSLIRTTVSGAGTVSFFWKVSSEAGYDLLEFFIDGVLQDQISGVVDWHQMVYTISDPGPHILEWRYVKDYSVSGGDDSGWVDLLEWSGVIQPPSNPLSEALDTSLSFTTDGDAGWFSQTAKAFFDGDAAQSGEMGALPTLYAATAPNVKSGDYFGPGGFMRMKGYPAPDKPRKGKIDPDIARRLWEVSEEMTGMKYASD